MAKQESDREDLIREATALLERLELNVEGEQEPWVVGFRGNGSGSVFAGVDPVFQFNSQLELRRAYWQGDLIKADTGRLHRLHRVRAEDAVQLVRTPLDEREQKLLLAAVSDVLRRLAASLDSPNRVSRQVAAGDDLPARVKRWAETLLSQPLRLADRPNAT